MERSQRPYAIYKRAGKRKKNEYRFYVRFRGEDGRYLTGVSSGQSSRAAAANWADAELAKGRIITPGKRGVTFGAGAGPVGLEGIVPEKETDLHRPKNAARIEHLRLKDNRGHFNTLYLVLRSQRGQKAKTVSPAILARKPTPCIGMRFLFNLWNHQMILSDNAPISCPESLIARTVACSSVNEATMSAVNRAVSAFFPLVAEPINSSLNMPESPRDKARISLPCGGDYKKASKKDLPVLRNCFLRE